VLGRLLGAGTRRLGGEGIAERTYWKRRARKKTLGSVDIMLEVLGLERDTVLSMGVERREA
jgi:hypothetical protein